MKIPDKIRLEHIREAIAEIESYVANLNQTEFINSSMVRAATVRQFEVIGEAAKSVSVEFQEAHPQIPWRLWGDFRNVLIHQYFGVDYAEVYQTIQVDLPSLKLQIEQILTKQD